MRQDTDYRIKGKYARVNPCQGCGKSAGVEYSCHPLTDTGDWNDIAICLCDKCLGETKDMTSIKDFLRYRDIKQVIK